MQPQAGGGVSRRPIWQVAVALVAAVGLVYAVLTYVEHGRGGNTSNAARAGAAGAASTTLVPDQVNTAATLDAAITHLGAAASLIRRTLPDLDPGIAAKTAGQADGVAGAANLGRQLAAAIRSRTVDASSRSRDLAGQFQSSLAAEQARSAALQVIIFPIQFCPFTIQIGPIVIDIPRIGLHIVIGPFFVHFVAPCFLSGRIPTQLPPTTAAVCLRSALFAAPTAACPVTKQFPITPAPGRFDSVTMCVITKGANLTSGACDPVTALGGAHVVQVACTGSGPVSGTVKVEDADGVTTTRTWSGVC